MSQIASTLDDETSNLILSAQRQQKDLSEFQIPRLRTCKGPLPLQQNLAAELREDIEAFARKVEVGGLTTLVFLRTQIFTLGSRCVGWRPEGGRKTESVDANYR